MNIQMGFITNSSSTAYIIFVPNGFIATDKEIDAAINQCRDLFDEDFELTDEQRENVSDVVEMMKEGEVYDCDEGDYLWIACLQMFTNEDFVLDGVELHSGECATMKGIREERIISSLTNYVDLDKMVNTLVKGANDERQNKK